MLSKGFLMGDDRADLQTKGQGSGVFGSALQQEPRLMTSRLDRHGAETSPLRQEAPVADLKFYYPDLDVSRLRELRQAQTVRAPLERLFNAEGALSAEGRALLTNIVRMRTAKPYRVVVRARTDAGDTGPDGLACAVQVARFIRRQSPPETGPVDVCDRDPLAATTLEAGRCEIILLED